MTLEDMKLAKKGREYWLKYVQLNGYSFEPTESGLRVLSKNLNLNISYLRKCIYAYLAV